MPTDMLAIYRTLVVLDGLAERSFARFVYLAVHNEKDQSTAVRKLAAALHFLTYADIGTLKAHEVGDRIAELEVELREGKLRKRLDDFHGDPETFVAGLKETFDPYGKKRLWCSIRDYLKSRDFNNHLVAALGQISLREGRRWCRDSIEKAALAALELPCDVWNNNPIFRDGLFSPHIGSLPKTWDMPRTIREIHSKMGGQDAAFYPEQLDVTFDFVPRMCDRLKCRHCIFGGGIHGVCHQQPDCYCPVALAACGYFHLCRPNECAFKSNSLRRACRSSVDRQELRRGVSQG